MSAKMAASSNKKARKSKYAISSQTYLSSKISEAVNTNLLVVVLKNGVRNSVERLMSPKREISIRYVIRCSPIFCESSDEFY